MRISDWSSDVCSSDLQQPVALTARLVDVAQCRVELLLAHHRAEPRGRVQRIAGADRTRDLDDLLDEAVGDVLLHQQARGGRADLALVEEHARPEERRVGKGWYSTCRSRWAA